MNGDSDGPGALVGPDWRVEHTTAARPRGTGPASMADYLVAEIEARIRYGKEPWLARLVTAPPAGWPGGHGARVGAWCATRIRRRAEKETDE